MKPMNCTKCGKDITSGYETRDGVFCTTCEHSKTWAINMRTQPVQNGREAQEDERLSAAMTITADDYLNESINMEK